MIALSSASRTPACARLDGDRLATDVDGGIWRSYGAATRSTQVSRRLWSRRCPSRACCRARGSRACRARSSCRAGAARRAGRRTFGGERDVRRLDVEHETVLREHADVLAGRTARAAARSSSGSPCRCRRARRHRRDRGSGRRTAPAAPRRTPSRSARRGRACGGRGPRARAAGSGTGSSWCSRSSGPASAAWASESNCVDASKIIRVTLSSLAPGGRPTEMPYTPSSSLPKRTSLSGCQLGPCGAALALLRARPLVALLRLVALVLEAQRHRRLRRQRPARRARESGARSRARCRARTRTRPWCTRSTGQSLAALLAIGAHRHLDEHRRGELVVDLHARGPSRSTARGCAGRTRRPRCGDPRPAWSSASPDRSRSGRAASLPSAGPSSARS